MGIGIAQNGIATNGIARNGIAKLGIVGSGGGLSPADEDKLITWSTPPYTDNEVTDAVSPLVLSSPATYGDCKCLLMTGAESIEIIGLTASNVITLGYGSTATPTAGTDTITFTAGIVSGIYIDGERYYNCAEGEGSTLYSLDNGTWPDATLSTDTVRSTAAVTPWNLGGHSKRYIAMDMVWRTTTANESITIPAANNGAYSGYIYWGDGTVGQMFGAYNDANLTHPYANAGDHQVLITGEFGQFAIDGSGMEAKLISVNNMGYTSLKALASSFRDATSAVSFSFGDFDGGDGITSLQSTWLNCTSAASFPVVSSLINLTSIRETWFGCSASPSFPEVDNLINLTTLQSTWRGCTSATSFPVVNSLINVTTLNSTWYGCASAPSFPEVNNLINVTTLYRAWRGCSASPSFPEVDNLINLTTIREAWYGCVSLTRLDSMEHFNWANVTTGQDMLTGVTLDTDNWDAILVNIANQAPSIQSNVALGGGNSLHTATGQAAIDLLEGTYGWTVTDGGLA